MQKPINKICHDEGLVMTNPLDRVIFL